MLVMHPLVSSKKRTWKRHKREPLSKIKGSTCSKISSCSKSKVVVEGEEAEGMQLVEITVREKRGKVNNVEMVNSNMAAEVVEGHSCWHQ